MSAAYQSAFLMPTQGKKDKAMNEELRVVSKAFSNALSDRSSRDIRKLTLDYDTFVRIVTTQAVIRALNRISETPS